MTASKIVAAAASGASGEDPVDIDEIFNITLYEGNGAAQTITNNIDLSGEGGLVWVKERTATSSHVMVDTERGTGKYISSNNNNESTTNNSTITTFNSNGFVAGNDGATGQNGESYVAWTFRKQKRFFDVVTYTGNGTQNTQISHNLDAVPGMILIHKTDNGGANWMVYHRGMNGGTNPEQYYMQLNGTGGESTLASAWYNTAPTSTHFTIGDQNNVNENGHAYVAYLFAHNNSDGAFGPDQDEDVIKCGYYSGSNSGVTVDLGFEPQWLFIKRRDGSGNWVMVDVMRGQNVVTSAGDNSKQLRANLDSTENSEYNPFPTATGFEVYQTAGGGGGGTNNYIYVAIRRGPLNTPTDATKVFHLFHNSSNLSGKTVTGFPADWTINTLASGTDKYTSNRLLGGAPFTSPYLRIHTTSAVTSAGSGTNWFTHSTGTKAVDLATSWWTTSSNVVGYFWRRAPGFFDIAHYYGNGGGVSVNHNLEVAPQMTWIKRRDASGDWGFHFNAGTGEYAGKLNSTDDLTSSSISFTRQAHRIVVYNTNFPVDLSVNGANYIAYFFTTCAGVSKCGTYTGNASTNTIDCGFSSGARFVLIRQASTEGGSTQKGWHLWDSARGIVSGNDPYFKLNDNTTAQTGSDWIDPHSSGFQLTNAGGNDANASGRTYLFYAIA